MTLFVDFFIAIRDFFERGGDVLWAIFFATILMWTLIIERIWFFYGVLPEKMREAVDFWERRDDTSSWYARRVRDQIISEVALEAHRFILVIKTLMAVLPLLGLLGTVTGMIEVFDVMAVAGTGNARLMAGGVSKATIPTMSGLVAALSGLYLASYLEHTADEKVAVLEDHLVQN